MNFRLLAQIPGALYRKHLQKWLILIAETLGDGRHPLCLISPWKREKYHEADTLPVLRFAPRQVIDIKVKLKESKRFWSNLSDEICSRGNITEADDEQCWNSHAKGRWGRCWRAWLGRFLSDNNAAPYRRGSVCRVSLSRAGDGPAICCVWQRRSMAPSFGPLQVITRWCNKRATGRLPLPGAILRIALNLVAEEISPGQ